MLVRGCFLPRTPYSAYCPRWRLICFISVAIFARFTDPIIISLPLESYRFLLAVIALPTVRAVFDFIIIQPVIRVFPC